LKTSHKPQQLH